MRNSFRLIASTTVGIALLLSIGVGSSLAKAVETETYDLSDAWCFQDVVELYCTVRSGEFTIETKHSGDVVATIDMTSTTTVTVDGAFVATYTTTSKDSTTTDPDGSYTFASKERSRWTDGEQTCTSLTRLRIVDFEVVIDSIRWDCH